MSYKITKTQTFSVTPEKAAAHLALTPVGVDCKVRPKKMADLRSHIIAGTFHSCEWGIIYCLEDGLSYRVNGKNTSTLFSDPSLVYGDIRISCTFWECDTLLEMSRIYATYDRKLTTRLASDNYKAVAAYVPSLKKAVVSLIGPCVTGISCGKYGPSYDKKVSVEERAQELPLNDDYCAFVREIYDSKEVTSLVKEKFRKGSIFASMWLCFKEDREAAKVFWGRVFRGDGNMSTKERGLNTYILTTPLKAVKGDSGTERTENQMKKCLRVYDAWWKENSEDYTSHRRKEVLAKRKELREARLAMSAKKSV